MKNYLNCIGYVPDIIDGFPGATKVKVVGMMSSGKLIASPVKEDEEGSATYFVMPNELCEYHTEAFALAVVYFQVKEERAIMTL